MLRRTDKIKVISARRKLKGQKVPTSEELTKSNFMLLKKLQEHNLIDQAWSHNGMFLPIIKQTLSKELLTSMLYMIYLLNVCI